MTEKNRLGEFALYLDESGSPKPNPNDPARFFAMGGVLIKRSDEQVIEENLSALKSRWHIAQETPLHGSEIRSCKKHFAWLGTLSQAEQDRFMQDLTRTITSCPIIVHACVVSRDGYIRRYLNRYGENTWEMMKSAFSIVVERTAKYAATRNGTLMVYFEQIGKKEDNLIKGYFNDLRSVGHPFNPTTANQYSPLSANELSSLLRGVDGKTKNNPLVQLADLCLYPVAKGKYNSENRAFLALKNASLIVDCLLEPIQVGSLGVKYYCFDNT